MRQAKKFMKRTAMLLIMVTVLLSSGMATGMFTGELITAEAAAMKLNVKTVELVPNETLTLSVANAGKKKVVWKSSNKKVATVSPKGIVTAKDNIGKSCTITATVGKKKFKCKVSVIESKLYGTYMVNESNFTLSGTALDGETHIEDAYPHTINVSKQKNGYYFVIAVSMNSDMPDSDYWITDSELHYIGDELPDCLLNPTKRGDDETVNLFMDVNDNYVFETWRDYTQEEWDQRMKELGYEI